MVPENLEDINADDVFADMRCMSVYLLTNNTNQKKYVGITVNLKHRLSCHISGKDNFAIQKALNKYGTENFGLRILFVLREENAKMAERELIKHLGTRSPRGYNLTDGGDGTLGAVLTKKHRQAVTKSNRNRKLSPSHKEKLTFRGLRHSAETKARMRQSALRRWHGQGDS